MVGFENHCATGSMELICLGKSVAACHYVYEFVRLAGVEGSNISAWCSRFGIACKTGYKWLKRYREEGITWLRDQSRRPHHVRAATPSVDFVRYFK